jgi:hypothetical protein
MEKAQTSVIAVVRGMFRSSCHSSKSSNIYSGAMKRQLPDVFLIVNPDSSEIRDCVKLARLASPLSLIRIEFMLMSP